MLSCDRMNIVKTKLFSILWNIHTSTYQPVQEKSVRYFVLLNHVKATKNTRLTVVFRRPTLLDVYRNILLKWDLADW